MTRQEVANLAGTTREITTTVLRRLREAGVLEIENRQVTLLDVEALCQFAQQH